MQPFVHLHVHSPWSFLDGAGRLEDLVKRAARLDMPALALTDHNTLSGTVRFDRLAKEAGIKPIIGAEVTLDGGYHLVLLARNAQGYSNLCRLLTRTHLDRPRGRPSLAPAALSAFSEGLFALSGCRRGEVPSLLFRGQFARAREAAARYRNIFGPAGFFLELSSLRLPGTRRLNALLAELAEALGLETVVTNNVHYTVPAEFPVHDLLTCVRTGTTLDMAHPERRPNAENYLKTAAEVRTALGGHHRAFETAVRLAEACEPSLPDGKGFRPVYPAGGEPAAAVLRRLVYEGAQRRYGTVSGTVRERLDHELAVITGLGFEDYFLIARDIVLWAGGHGIRCTGRGSAADSAVAYCLFLTDVDPVRRGLLFERFMSLERAQPPDIDLDFDARHRDRVTAYVYSRYGEDHVATVATFNTFRARSAVRQLGKAMMLPPAEVERVARNLPPFLPADAITEALDTYPESRALALDRERWDRLIRACAGVAGFPRFTGAHLGGIIITGPPVTGLTPLQLAAKGVNIAQFDKDDIEDLGLAKLDLLSLRMLSAVEETARTIRVRDPAFDYDGISEDDAATYAMLRRGETLGVFQLESPAQRALQARLGANRFEDIVASVALIRPGPIKGDMVEPFLKRRQGREPVSYPDPRLESILRKTYGVVLFQEQVIEVATVIAGFTPGEADRLRRVMTHGRSRQEMDEIGKLFVRRAIANGSSPAAATEVFRMIQGYASYGFCEAHAAAFAVTAARTAYLARHYPAEFYAGLLSCQPMGYYPPHVLAGEARRRGVPVLGPCVNRSLPRCSVEGTGKSKAIRLGLGLVRGMTAAALRRIVQARQAGPFTSLADFCRRVEAPRQVVENLILVGAFDDTGCGRRRLLWEYGAVRSTPPCGDLFHPDGQNAGGGGEESRDPRSVSSLTADFSLPVKIACEFELIGTGVSGHPLAVVRERLRRQGCVTTRDIRRLTPGTAVSVAGLPVRPHRPPTRSGRKVVFMSLEDEHGLADVTVCEEVYRRDGRHIFAAPARVLKVTGTVYRRGQAVGLNATAVEPLAVRQDPCS